MLGSTGEHQSWLSEAPVWDREAPGWGPEGQASVCLHQSLTSPGWRSPSHSRQQTPGSRPTPSLLEQRAALSLRRIFSKAKDTGKGAAFPAQGQWTRRAGEPPELRLMLSITMACFPLTTVARITHPWGLREKKQVRNTPNANTNSQAGLAAAFEYVSLLEQL